MDKNETPESASLESTISDMTSYDYKERFRAEYKQTKIRYEKLKAFNTRIEAYNSSFYQEAGFIPLLKGEDCPVHNCQLELLRRQQRVMGEYLHILEVRAVMENISL